MKLLKYKSYLPVSNIRKHILILESCDILSFKKIFSSWKTMKKSEYIEKGRFSTSRFTHEYNKFLFINSEINSFENGYFFLIWEKIWFFYIVELYENFFHILLIDNYISFFYSWEYLNQFQISKSCNNILIDTRLSENWWLFVYCFYCLYWNNERILCFFCDEFYRRTHSFTYSWVFCCKSNKSFITDNSICIDGCFVTCIGYFSSESKSFYRIKSDIG